MDTSELVNTPMFKHLGLFSQILGILIFKNYRTESGVKLLSQAQIPIFLIKVTLCTAGVLNMATLILILL